VADTNPATSAGGAGATTSTTSPASCPGVQIRVVRDEPVHGNPAFQGEQDADPLNGTDCRLGSPGAGPVPVFGDLPQVLAPRGNEVSIAELQVFGSAVRVE
jgi:hypothetical protein